MNGDQLVRMINDISGFFVSESDQNEAVEGCLLYTSDAADE